MINEKKIIHGIIIMGGDKKEDLEAKRRSLGEVYRAQKRGQDAVVNNQWR